MQPPNPREVVMNRLRIAAATVALAWAIFPPGPAGAADDEILLGAAISQSGKYAREGKFYVDAYTIGVDAVNKAGGVKVGGKARKLALKLYDDQSDPALAARLCTKLVTSDKVNFLLGPSTSGIVRAPSACAAKYEI